MCLYFVLFLIRLYLHAMNGVGVPAKHRAFYQWLSMIVLTYLIGPCITNQQKMAYDTIPVIYLMVRLDVIKPQKTNTKVIDNQFGTICQDTREFNIHELSQM